MKEGVLIAKTFQRNKETPAASLARLKGLLVK
jgi:hypothetical protein